SLIDEPQIRPTRSENRGRVRAQPIREDGSVVGTKIVVDEQISVRVKVGQARGVAVNASLDGIAYDEMRRRCAVVGAVGGIVVDPTPELRPGHEQDVVGLAMSVEIVEEGFDSIRYRLDQTVVRVVLVGVVIETAEGHVEDLRADVRVDDLGDQLKSRAETSRRI